MRACFICIFILVFLSGTGFAQATTSGGSFTDSVGDANASNIGGDKPVELKQVTVNDCEEAAFWDTKMAQDEGLITIRTLPGNPKEKETADAKRLADERKIRNDDKWLGSNVLGVRVSFYRRGYDSFALYPVKPIPIAGTSKIISVWVIGRNYNHELKVILADYYGNLLELPLGKLNFSGWKKLSVAVPPQVVQSNYHFTDKEGLKFIGLKVECNADEAYGTYYIYFDDISAETDLFSATTRDDDDMVDGW
jgi:hypothetical protein